LAQKYLVKAAACFEIVVGASMGSASGHTAAR
jgi:hypothetical protein